MMGTSTAGDVVALAHLLGFSTSMALYAMLAVMTVRDRQQTRGARPLTLGGGALALTTAALGLAWNSAALVSFAARDLGLGNGHALVDAVAYSALGLLPAVVIHSAMRGLRTPFAGSAILAGYLLGGLAAVAHVVAAIRVDMLPGSRVLAALAAGYVIVVVVLAFAVRGRLGARRPLTAAALAVFAAGALHLGSHGDHAEPLLLAIVGHHASLVLALVVLYQDYRFALADIFLKRVLTILALVVLAWTLHATVAEPFIFPRLAGGGSHVFAVAALLGLWVATAMSYPLLSRGVEWLVDRQVLRRTDHMRMRTALASGLAVLDSPADILDLVSGTLRSALSASSVAWRTLPDSAGELARGGGTVHASVRGNGGAMLVIPTVETPRLVIEIGELEAGRRVLSGDLGMLEQVAGETARRIDAVRVTAERHERDLREESIRRLASEAELRVLRSQLEPHFLFNALNTLAELIQSAPDRALATVYRLTALLRAVLTESGRDLLTLGEELDLIESYLAIESERFEERLHVKIEVPAECRAAMLPPLLVQPLVENAIKHGIALRRAGGTVRISAGLEVSPESGGGRLRIGVEDYGAPAVRARASGAGVGLASVRGRLQRQYGGAASLTFSTSPGRSIAELLLPAGRGGAVDGNHVQSLSQDSSCQEVMT